MKLEDFDYRLPPRLIAQTPVEPRDASRLMVFERETGQVSHDHFRNLTRWLRPSDLLVRNRSKVLPARLSGVKEETGARLEVFLLRPLSGSETRGQSVPGEIKFFPENGGMHKSLWEVMLRPAKRLKVGQTLIFGPQRDWPEQTTGAEADQMRGRLIDILPNTNRIMEFEHQGSFDEVLEKMGSVPLPPYITATLADQGRYQTVYAREAGSVAAPTAGLHFTPELLRRIEDMGVETAEVLLHVGPGTFRPVQRENISEHKMHAEYYEISAETVERLQRARAESRRIVAVGTTTARTLESWGAAAHQRTAGWTDIFIYPGYTFRWVDALITNFHFPRSTLLMLVSALAGRERVLAAYEEAVREEYRFYSFGDAMFIV